MAEEPSAKRPKLSHQETSSGNLEHFWKSAILNFTIIVHISDEKSRKYEETRKQIAKELLLMPSEASTSASAGDKPKKSKEETEAEERERMQ